MSGGTVWRQGSKTISTDQFTRRWPERTERMFTTTIRNQHGQVIGVDVQWLITHCDRCGGSLEGCPVGYSEDWEWVHDDCAAGNRLPSGAT